MSRFRRHPLFASGLIMCALVALIELGLMHERHSALKEAEHKLGLRQAEMAALEQLVPPPTREVAAAIETDLAQAQRALTAVREDLMGRGAANERMLRAVVPAARTDAFFDLATFVERMRELAAKNSVEVRPEAARFGFSAHVNEGPELERIAPVFRQRLVAHHLLEALLEARPLVLLAVRREPPKTKAEREAAQATGGVGEAVAGVDDGAPDFFTIDPRVSARIPGHLDTMAFRLVFAGQTAALRTFLNRIAAFELPVLVREIEVEPFAATEEDEREAPPPAPSVTLTVSPPAARPAASRGGVALPIVSRSLSRFTVTLEFLEFVPEAPASEAPTT